MLWTFGAIRRSFFYVCLFYIKIDDDAFNQCANYLVYPIVYIVLEVLF